MLPEFTSFLPRRWRASAISSRLANTLALRVCGGQRTKCPSGSLVVSLLFQSDLALATLGIERRIGKVVDGNRPKTFGSCVPETKAAAPAFSEIPVAIFQCGNWKLVGRNVAPAFSNISARSLSLGNRGYFAPTTANRSKMV